MIDQTITIPTYTQKNTHFITSVSLGRSAPRLLICTTRSICMQMRCCGSCWTVATPGTAPPSSRRSRAGRTWAPWGKFPENYLFFKFWLNYVIFLAIWSISMKMVTRREITPSWPENPSPLPPWRENTDCFRSDGSARLVLTPYP